MLNVCYPVVANFLAQSGNSCCSGCGCSGRLGSRRQRQLAALAPAARMSEPPRLDPHVRLAPSCGTSVDPCAVNDLPPLEDQIPVCDAKREGQMLLDDDDRCADLVTNARQDF